MKHAALWHALANGDVSAREALLTEHLDLVHHVARQLSRTLASHADHDELVSAGTIGLMDAVESFDWTRGFAFSTFAVPRIRGAILDELRRLDHVPRSVRRKTRELSAAREALTHRLGRAPEVRELARHLGEDVETVWRWQADAEGAVHISIDRTAGESEEGAPSSVPALPDTTIESIDDRLTLDQEARFLRETLLRLKEQERIVLTLYYFEQLRLHEIASILAVTESRVSQIRTKALSKLRGELAPLRAAVA
jgi:RNA polymerase sigma factor for flagellar operon FliA